MTANPFERVVRGRQRDRGSSRDRESVTEWLSAAVGADDELPNGDRRRILRLFCAAAGAGLAGAAPSRRAFAAAGNSPLRIGLTPAFLHDQHGLLADWHAYMQQKLRRSVQFVQRDGYRETMDLLRLGQLDFAWICDYPFIHLRDQVRLLAVALYRGRPFYRSYLIVAGTDLHTSSLAQLKGTVFAYADPYSNTGYLAPRYALHRLGENPARFFRKTFFTYSHRKVIEAVAAGLAVAGAVDSYVWESLAVIEPAITRQTRIVSRSEEYGFPPFVAHVAVRSGDFEAMQRMLLGMSGDAEGAALLRRFNLGGFVPGDASLYEGVARMMRAFGEA